MKLCCATSSGAHASALATLTESDVRDVDVGELYIVLLMKMIFILFNHKPPLHTIVGQLQLANEDILASSHIIAVVIEPIPKTCLWCSYYGTKRWLWSLYICRPSQSWNLVIVDVMFLWTAGGGKQYKWYK